jgi:hypothetical protein
MKETVHLGDVCIRGKIILKWVLSKKGQRFWSEVIHCIKRADPIGYVNVPSGEADIS